MFNKKWFLFVEGSIITIIAVSGILSAALFPSLTSYLSRGRDTARAAWIKEISTALAAYYVDNDNYPVVPPSGCIPAKDLAKYLPKVPTDPSKGHLASGCDGSDGMSYAYRVFKDKQWKKFSAIAADLENHNWWNSSLGLDEIILSERPTLEYIDTLRKWDGSHYIIRN